SSGSTSASSGLITSSVSAPDNGRGSPGNARNGGVCVLGGMTTPTGRELIPEGGEHRRAAAAHIHGSQGARARRPQTRPPPRTAPPRPPCQRTPDHPCQTRKSH